MNHNDQSAMNYVRENACDILESIKTFSQNEAVFSVNDPRLIDGYEDQWIGVYRGRIAAAANSLDEVKTQLSSDGVPLGEAMIRRIDREEKTYIF